MYLRSNTANHVDETSVVSSWQFGSCLLIQNGPIGWFHFAEDPNFPSIENRKPRGYNLIDCHYDCMGVFFSNKTASLQFSFAHQYYSWSKKALCKPQTNKNMQCDRVPIPTATLGTSWLERCVHHRLQNLKFNKTLTLSGGAPAFDIWQADIF